MSTLIANTLQGINTIKYDANTTAMTIDNNGIVSNGTHVFARASSANQATAGNDVLLNTGQETSGGCTFQDTNTSIQVPVAGLYLIGFHTLGNSGSGNLQMHIRKNGTALPGTHIQETGSANDVGSATTIAQLAANDKITFHVGSGTTHQNSSFNNHYVVKIG